MSDSGTATLDDGGGEGAKEKEDHHHHEPNGEHQLKLHILDRGADGAGAIGENGDIDRGRQCGLKVRQQLFYAVHHVNDVRAGLPPDIHDDGRRVIHPGGKTGVLNPIDDVGHVR